MQTKLTLRMEDSVINSAKEFAMQQGTSLSKLVSNLLQLHIKQNKANNAVADEEFQDAMKHPFLQKSVGAISEEDLPQDDYSRYLEEKYK